MFRIALALFVIALPGSALAQSGPAAGANPVSRAIKASWAGAKKNIVESAQQMPDADFDFRPVATVRTFSAILAHVAGANYEYCAAARAEKSPHAEDEFEKNAKTKAAIVKALQESLAYCDKAYDALTDQSAGEVVAGAFGSPRAARAVALIDNAGHLQEHYGNLVTYFRIKGMVPPSSKGQ